MNSRSNLGLFFFLILIIGMLIGAIPIKVWGEGTTDNGDFTPQEYYANNLNIYSKYSPAIINHVYPTEDGGELLYIAAYTGFNFSGSLVVPDSNPGGLYLAKVNANGEDEWVTLLTNQFDEFGVFFGEGGIVTHPTQGIVVTGSDYTVNGMFRGGSHISLVTWDGQLKWTIDSSFGQRFVTVDIQDEFVTILGRTGLFDTASNWLPPITPPLPTLKSASLLRYDMDGNLIANVTFAIIRTGSWFGSMDDTLVFPFGENEYLIDTRDCWKATNDCLVIDDRNDQNEPSLISNNTELVRIRFEDTDGLFISDFSETECETNFTEMTLRCSDAKFESHIEELTGRPGYDGQSEFVRRELSEEWFNKVTIPWINERLTIDRVFFGNDSSPFDFLLTMTCRAEWGGEVDDCQLGERFQFNQLIVDHTVVGVLKDGNFTPITLYGYPDLWTRGVVFSVFSIEQVNSTTYLIHGTHSGSNLSILGQLWTPVDPGPVRSFRFHVNFDPIVNEEVEPVIPIIPENNSTAPIIEPEIEIPCEEWTNGSNCAIQEPIVEPELEEEEGDNLSLTNEPSQNNDSDGIPLVIVAGAGILSLGVIISRKRELIAGLFGGGLLGVIGSRARKYTPGVRTLIIDLITFEPGIHQSEICRRLNLSSSQIQHHTEILLQEGSIHRQKSGRRVTYFPISFDAELNEEKVLIPTARENNLDTREKLILLLQESENQGGFTQRLFAEKLECSQPNINKHLQRLQDEGIANKLEKVWGLTEIGSDLAEEIKEEHHLVEDILN